MNPLEPFLSPRNIAIVGTSRTPGRPGYNILNNAVTFGFKGKIFPINPSQGNICGLKVYPTLTSVPERVDLVVSLIPAPQTLPLLKEAKEKGVRGIIICSGGFSEAGEEGNKLQRAVLSSAQQKDIRILGPNIPGIINTSALLVLSIGSINSLTPGSTALVSQTGQFCTNVIEWIHTHLHLGISKSIDLGNKVDIDDADVLGYLKDDPSSKVIALHMEGLKRGRSFVEIAKQITPSRPVVVFKTGRTKTGAQAALSHSGSLSSEDKVVEGIFRQAGLIRAYNLEEFFDYVKIFSFFSRIKGNRLGIITITGGGSTMAVDMMEETGLTLSPLSHLSRQRLETICPPWQKGMKNPVDLGPCIPIHGCTHSYKESIQALMEDKEVDGILLIMPVAFSSHLLFIPDFSRIANIARTSPKPIVANLLGPEAPLEETSLLLEKEGIPVYPTPERAVRAIAAVHKHSQYTQISENFPAPGTEHLKEPG
jgi:acyl-CoA synthetase (NDP forming)